MTSMITRQLDWSRIRPFLGVAAAFVAWDLAVRFSDTPILPGPLAVMGGLLELVMSKKVAPREAHFRAIEKAKFEPFMSPEDAAGTHG